ncbi:hypothetical protein OHA45_02755 [Streptomyces lydicus]|uniref:hypothetical protein n=1 Tax=Streptomyces lydicus TaxID=47763 RepID=UPI002E335DC0|nr:hypothetical protein [Streptomyces lydicus]
MTELPGIASSVVTTLRMTMVVALVGVSALFGVVQPTGTASAASRASGTPAHAVAAPGPVVAPPRTPAAASPQAAPIQPQPQPDPANVVVSYFVALNENQFEAAWALGGKNISGQPYESFEASYFGTDHNVLSVVPVVGNDVTLTLEVTESNGSHHREAGTYTVQDGVIVSARTHRI